MLLKRNLKNPPRSSFGILRPPIFHPKKIEGPPISPPPPLPPTSILTRPLSILGGSPLTRPNSSIFWNSIGIQHGGYACRNINAPKMQCRLLVSRRQTIVNRVFSYFRHRLAKDNAPRGKVKFTLFIFITLFDAKFRVTSHWLSNNSDGRSEEIRKRSIPPGKNHGFTFCFI